MAGTARRLAARLLVHSVYHPAESASSRAQKTERLAMHSAVSSDAHLGRRLVHLWVATWALHSAVPSAQHLAQRWAVMSAKNLALLSAGHSGQRSVALVAPSAQHLVLHLAASWVQRWDGG